VSDRLPLGWCRVEPPPPPDGLIAEGAAALALAARLLAYPTGALARSELRGVSGPALLVVVGASDALPWVDGVCYLARVASTPGLYVPTWIGTTHPPSLVAAALGRVYGDGPLVLLPPLIDDGTGTRVLSLAEARPIAHETLTRWLAEQREPDVAEGSP
jgi:hypothetical protein